jgi:hypothetical protein
MFLLGASGLQSLLSRCGRGRRMWYCIDQSQNRVVPKNIYNPIYREIVGQGRLIGVDRIITLAKRLVSYRRKSRLDTSAMDLDAGGGDWLM